MRIIATTFGCYDNETRQGVVPKPATEHSALTRTKEDRRPDRQDCTKKSVCFVNKAEKK
jgi:hypothetical protein